MAVLKGNVVVRTQGGEVLTLERGTARADVEALADEYGPETRVILANPGHWVDRLDEPDESTNLLDNEDRTIRPRPAKAGKAPAGVVVEEAPGPTKSGK